MEEVNKSALDSLVGRSISAWSIGDTGVHFHLDDGKVAIISGVFWIAVMEAESEVLH